MTDSEYNGIEKVHPPTQVIKRNGDVIDFNPEKITSAIAKAMNRLEEEHRTDPNHITNQVIDFLIDDEDDVVDVDTIHKLVENTLMDNKCYEIARSYITYRENHKPNIFRERIFYKPFEYPELSQFVDAIQQSYWIVTEFNFTSDINDYKTNLTIEEKECIRRSMLAISQIEVAVKEFWGKIGDKFPKPEIQEVGATIAENECYDDQTEILTDQGWRYFSNLNTSEKVAQYDHETGEINFVKPIEYTTRWYKGTMHYYKGKTTDICVTPNHEILTMHPQKNYYEKNRSCDGKWARNYRFPCSGTKYDSGMEFTDEHKLLIALQADGSLYGECPSGEGRKDFTFTLKKQRKISRIETLMITLGMNYKKRERENGFIVISGSLNEFTNVNSNEIKSFDWVDISSIDSNWAEQFINELMFWDGSKQENNNHFVYYNTNENAVDVVQSVGILTGYSVFKGMNRTQKQSLKVLNPDGKHRQTSKNCYAVTITKKNKTVYPKRKEIDYEGYVYCVEVPKQNIVVRRNSSVAIQGNCRHSRAYSHLLELLGLNNEFEHVFKIPSINKRIDVTQRALKDKNCSDKDFIRSLVLFSIIVENVSLFSQFLIISTINKEKAALKGMTNVVSATSLEEDLHFKFGAALINTIRKEHPEMFDDELDKIVRETVEQSYEAEKEIIHWIFDQGELEYLSIDDVIEYIKNRYNRGMKECGFNPLFPVNDNKLEKTKWFDIQNTVTMHTDFFDKRPVNYSKFSSSFDEDSLF